MKLEGTIHNVMETWPPQLTFAVGNVLYHLVLTMETSVTEAGEDVGVGRLRPEQRVCVYGDTGCGNSFVVTSITILGEPYLQ